MDSLYRRLLQAYADGLIAKQLHLGDPRFDGGFLCPSCKVIHGRCIDAIYGLLVAYKTFGDPKYLLAAKDVFHYSENLLCTDGGLYNDLQTEWRFTTTFQQINLCEAIRSCGGLLDEEFRAGILNHIEKHAVWLYENLNEHSPANINYATTNALALLLSSLVLKEERYRAEAIHLMDYALSHISVSGFLYGEGKPHAAHSPKGCLAIDFGYNMEESVPALMKCAFLLQDESLEKRVYEIAKAHAPLLYPDGGMDNTFGIRNYKFSYWGSRTSDGIVPLYLLCAKFDPSFAELAHRNAELQERCFVDGLLAGGPDYGKHGEEPCVHHSFEHINSIAFAVDHFEEAFLARRAPCIPSDLLRGMVFYPEMASWRFGTNSYIASITDYDMNIPYSGHATGGALTGLYSRVKGPMIMGSVGDYQLTENTNMQVPLDRAHHRSLLPRIEKTVDGKLFSSVYATSSSHEVSPDGTRLRFETGLATREGIRLTGVSLSLSYEWMPDSIRIEYRGAGGLEFLLPLLRGEPSVLRGTLADVEDTFFLTGGFEAKEYRILPDEEGILCVEVNCK